MEYFQAVYRKSTTRMKSVSVYEDLKQELLTGKWSFGDKISVNELIEKFSVSRRPVMDAMKMLENDGYIEIIPQSGCKVVDYDKKSILDQLLLSSTLESLCAELAAIHYQPEEMGYLETFLENHMKQPESLNDKFAYLRFTREIHFAIFMMTHSDIIQKQTIKIWNLTDFYLLNAFDYFKFEPSETLASHAKMIAHIKDRDPVNAKKSMQEYTFTFIENLKGLLP